MGFLYLLPTLIKHHISSVTQPVRMIAQTVWLQAMILNWGVLCCSRPSNLLSSVCVSCHCFCIVTRKLSLHWDKNGFCLLRCLRVLSRKHSEVSVIRRFHWIKNQFNPTMKTFLAQRFWHPLIAVMSDHRPALITWKYPNIGRHHVAAIDVNVLGSHSHPRTREGGKRHRNAVFFLARESAASASGEQCVLTGAQHRGWDHGSWVP